MKMILLKAIIAGCLLQSIYAETYYISSMKGDDSNNGRTKEKPWKSLKKVNWLEYKPGDKILFERGSVFNERLILKGKGIPGKSITLDAYGVGNKPRFKGEGKHNSTVLMRNVECWSIRNIHLSNKGEVKKFGRYGIWIDNQSLSVSRNMELKNITISDVNGSFPKDKNAGGAIKVTVGTGKKYDNFVIADCHIKNCSRNGIQFTGGGLRGDNWNPSTNVLIERNLIEGVGGDGILPVGCKGVVVQWNVMRNCPRYGEEAAAAAGMWPWCCDDALFQFNEVSEHKAWVDGQAYDCDYSCRNTTFQYNYSHNNEGGFMLICSPGKKKSGWLAQNALNDSSVVKFNLSINDGYREKGGKKHYYSPTFSITGETTTNTKVHDNLIIIPKKKNVLIDPTLVDFGTWGGRAPVNTTIENNTFVLLNGQKGDFEIDKTARGVVISRNKFFGNVARVEQGNHVTAQANDYSIAVPRVIEFEGTKEELELFRSFLKKKGNPHEKYGVKISWKVRD